MATRSQLRHASQEADSLLQNLGVDQEAPVDVFDLVDQLGLWLVFNRLDNLLGAVLPRGVGGIMLSTQRGVAVQRYTAAHEIGHWVLDYGEANFDTVDDVYHPEADRELLAQVFASNLLMPPPLVYAVSARYGINDARSATPEGVYLTARDIGSSYEATARQLANLEIIPRTQRDQLLRIQPAAIKTALCRGHRPTGPVDVWPIGLDGAGTTLHVTEGDEVVVLLPENRTTGYRWLDGDDLAERAMREINTPPVIEDAVPVVIEPAWRPPPRSRSESAEEVKQALSRIPGNTGAVRVLPTQTPVWSMVDAPRPGARLAVVDDQFQVSRGPVPPSGRRAMRRAIPRATQRSGDGSADTAGTVVPAKAAVEVRVAGTGTRLLALRSLSEGAETVQLVYSSAYDPAAPSVESYQLDVQVAPGPEVLRRRLYLDIDVDEVERDQEERE